MSVQSREVPAAGPECPNTPCALRRYALLLAVAGVLYGPFIGLPHFGDDYLYLFEEPWAAVWRYFVTYHDLGGIFRPLQMAWCAINQALFGESTVVLQGGQVALHAGLALLVWRFLERRGVPRVAAAAAAVLFVVHPIHVSAVLGTDTGSQLAGALLGFVAFARAWEYAAGGARPTGARAAAEGSMAAGVLRGWPVVVLLALALLSKETALSYAVLVVIVLLYGAWRQRRLASGGAARGAVVLALVCILVTAAYFAYRSRMAPTRIAWSATDPYGFHIGVNVLRNQAFLFGGALVPASTSDLFAAVARRSGAVLGTLGGLTALWCGLLAVGLWRARRPAATVGLLLAASLTTFPVTLMNHVSELYIYNLTPLLAVLIGLALAPWLEPGEVGAAAEPASAASRGVAGAHAHAGRLRVLPLAILFLVAASSGLAVQRKAAEMRANGRAAEQLAAAVVAAARAASPGAMIVLWERPQPGRAYYSVFRTSDFQGLRVAERWLKHRAGRADVTIRVLDEDREPPADALVYVRVDANDRAELRSLSARP